MKTHIEDALNEELARLKKFALMRGDKVFKKLYNESSMFFWQPPSLNFAQTFQATFVKIPINPVSIPVDGRKPARILVLSDTALGGMPNPSVGVTGFISALERVIKAEQITHVVHIGDLVKFDAPSPLQLLESVLAQLGKLPVPVWLLGGNDDRDFLRQLTGGDRRGSVTIVREIAIVVPLPTGNRVFLAHDLGNTYRVVDQFAWGFVAWLKQNAAHAIANEDWLLVGHCHTQFLSTESRIGCVGSFSPDPPVWSYAVLSIAGEVNIEMKSEL
jgi:predicted phosphodiesterase